MLTQPILERADMSDRLEELTLLSISIAHEAIKESGKDVLLAASLPPLETSYRADLILDFDQMKEQYSELAAILEGKVDIIICETMAHSLKRGCLRKYSNFEISKMVSRLYMEIDPKHYLVEKIS